MSVKTVRFADITYSYSPLPIPSPSLSESSLPPSPLILTPPPNFTPLTRSPLRSIPDPAFNSPLNQHIRVHPLLEFSFEKPSLNHDLSLHPSTIYGYPSHHKFSEPASDPPLPSLTVICPHLPWSITATGAASFVTVSELLAAIYHALRLAVHPLEYDALPSPDEKLKVNASYEYRYRRIPDERAREEMRKGVKRVDFLRGRNRFLGLSSTRTAPDVFELNVE